ncbi:hypothetical protein pipiens_018841 [Culex pipiens pipiens]|uniref:C2H2-type domain-containing protein n=1 Tax=Culex pipiens pipiens TaxID=38569 RepID=A0ABD1DXX8_CULPP
MSCAVPGCEQATIAECPLLQLPRNESLRDRWYQAISAGTGLLLDDLDKSESGICSWHFGNAPLEEYREPRWFIDRQGQELEIVCCRFCLQFKNRNEMTCYEGKVGTQSIGNFVKQSLKVTLLKDSNFTDICQECLVRIDLLKSWVVDIQQVEAEFRSILVAFTQESMVPFESIGKYEEVDDTSLDNVFGTEIDAALLIEKIEDELEPCMQDDFPDNPVESEEEQMPQQTAVGSNANRPHKLILETIRKRGRRPKIPDKPPTPKPSYKDILHRKCFICNTLLESRTELMCHLTEAHATKIDYRCKECDKSFPLVSSFNHHLGFHDLENRPLKCNFCPLGFSTNDSLRNHEVREHNANHQKKITKRIARQFQCDTCGKTFNKGYQLTEHDDFYHKNRGAECKLCSRTFPSKNLLQKHQLVHSRERNYRCDQCGQAFTKSEILRAHKMKHEPNYAEWKAQQKKPPPRQRFRQRLRRFRRRKLVEEETGSWFLYT